MRQALLTAGFAVLLAGAFAVVRWSWPASVTANAALLASCLKRQGVVMYGAGWCSHCLQQQQIFGPAFSDIPYVECPQQPQRCLQAKIEGYPAWVFPDGRRLTGVQSLPTLAEWSGCPLNF